MKKSKKIFIGICLFFVIFLTVFFVLKYYKRMKVLSGISNEEYFLFSIVEDGTLKYYILDERLEKVSDYNFHDFSYSDDRKSIIGFMGKEGFEGLAELELSSNKLNTIISIEEINALLLDIEPDETDNIGKRNFSELRPKYCKSGYTFCNDDRDKLFYLEKLGDSWIMKKIYESEYGFSNYFVDEDFLYVKTKVESTEDDEDTYSGVIIKKDLNSGSTEILCRFDTGNQHDSRGCIDMAEDEGKIVYYDFPDIYVYDLASKQIESRVGVKKRKNEYMVDLKFSPDRKYLFYTLGRDPFFPGTPRLRFFILNLETMERIELKKWNSDYNFYGFDW